MAHISGGYSAAYSRINPFTIASLKQFSSIFVNTELTNINCNMLGVRNWDFSLGSISKTSI